MIEQISTLVELLDLLSLDHRIILREGDQPMRRIRQLQEIGLAGNNDDLIVAMSNVEPSELHRVFAAISLRPELLDTPQINRLHEFLIDDKSSSLQTAIARQLRLAKSPIAIEKLFDAILRCPDPQLRSVIAFAIAENTSVSWQKKCHLLQKLLKQKNYYREHLDFMALVTAIRPPTDKLIKNRFLLTSFLIGEVIRLTEHVERLTGIFAGLVVASVGGNISRANQLIDEYQDNETLDSPSLTLLHKEINSWSPSFERKIYLDEAYTAPLRETQDEIRSIWKSSLNNLNSTMRSRRWLGTVGILSGLIILLVSVPVIILGLSGGFILALIGILIFSSAILYGGPIRDVKQSVKELSAANVVYMAYTQRVLEISTSFKHLFLKNQLSQEGVVASNELIGKAMNDAIKALRAEGETTLDEFLKKLGN